MGGARRVEIFEILDIAEGSGSVEWFVQRGLTVARLGGYPTSTTGRAALEKMAELLAG